MDLNLNTLVDKGKEVVEEYKKAFIYFKNNPKEALVSTIPWLTIVLVLILFMLPLVGIKKVRDGWKNERG